MTPGMRHGCARGLRLLRLAATVIVAASLLSGCVVRVVYDQLDWLTLWYVDGYFDLDRTQEEQARQLIAATLEWHRRVQLPRYAILSRDLAARATTPVSAEFVAARYGDILELWDEFLRRVSGDVAILLRGLSDRQVEHLFAKLADDNRDLATDYSGKTRDERRAKQDKAIVRAFQRFTGRLDREQVAIIRERNAGLHDLSADWLQRRADWQQAFRALLADRAVDPRFQDRLTDLLLDPNQFDAAHYREQVVDNQRQAFAMVASVVNSLSTSQADHMREKFTTYADDFDALIREQSR